MSLICNSTPTAFGQHPFVAALVRSPSVLARLSLDQKIDLLAGADLWHTAGFAEPPVPAIRTSDGPAGVRGTTWDGVRSASFPCGSALGATWDPDLVREVGEALGREARSKSAHVLLAPTVNLHRTPIGGRNFECFSEDPVLTAELAVAYIEGVQSAGVAACVKHFAGNDTEFERMSISSEIDERTLRELYLVPFEAAVGRAGVRAVMSGYNRLNGTFCSEHRWLLTDLLRDEWGFDGAVISDWFGTHSAGPSLVAGLDLEMPGPPRARGPHLRAALEAGEVAEADLDRSVARLLDLAEWTGAAGTGTDEITADDPATDAVIRRAATRAMVLLKNEGSLLPLAPDTGRIALIGPNAKYGRVQGGGSARVKPVQRPGPLDALRDRGLDVSFTPGGAIDKYLPTVHGQFTVERADGEQAPIDRLSWRDGGSVLGDRDGLAVRIAGGFVPETSGTWEFGVRAIGPVAVRLDGAPVVELPEAQRGGSFYGLGSPEVRAVTDVEAGHRYELEVDIPAGASEPARRVMVGARAVTRADHVEQAAVAAAGADVAVVIVGTDDNWETEGEDRTTMGLPGDQDELVAAVARANPNTVVVVNAGSPVTMPWLEAVPAVLQLWFPGQALGEALADVVTGDVEPGGRLPITFPMSLEDTPAFNHHPGRNGLAVYAEGAFIGHRWYDRERIAPRFPFGHGLGYTTFEIHPGGLSGSTADGVSVTVDVTNTGGRAGTEVIQVYVEPPPGDPRRPLRHLAGFRRVDLGAGASIRATIELGRRAFAVWQDDRWTVPPGSYTVLVGRSSRDLAPAGTIA
jgi:beta-glucosidase